MTTYDMNSMITEIYDLNNACLISIRNVWDILNIDEAMNCFSIYVQNTFETGISNDNN